jgi:hypothetical protein
MRSKECRWREEWRWMRSKEWRWREEWRWMRSKEWRWREERRWEAAVEKGAEQKIGGRWVDTHIDELSTREASSQ